MSTTTEIQSRLHLALNAARMAIWESTLPDGRIENGEVLWSPEGASVLGLAGKSFIQSFTSFLQSVHPHDRELVKQRLQRAVDRRLPYTLQYRVIWPDFSIHWVAAQGHVDTDADGHPLRTLGVIWDISAGKWMEERLHFALDGASMALWESDAVTDEVRMSARDAPVLGLPAAPFCTSFEGFLAIVHPDDRWLVRQTIQAAIDALASYGLDYRILWPDGSVHWISAKGKVYTDGRGKPECTLGLLWDVTDRYEILNALDQQKELAETTLRAIADGVVTTNAAGEIQFLNRAAEHLTGWSTDTAKGHSVTQVLRIVDEASGMPIDNPAIKCLQECKSIRTPSVAKLIARDGREIPIQDSAAPILARDGRLAGAVWIFHDVSHERHLKHQLSWQATHDALTGLANRKEFEARLTDALASAKSSSATHALLYLDLDQFKIVNDTCGHMAGDELLRQLAAVLHAKMRDSDLLARLGGDELGVLLHNCPISQAHYLSDELRQTVKAFRFVWGQHIFEIGVSIGLVAITGYSISVSELMSAADRACYIAKEKGRNRVHLFRESDEALLERHGEMLWISRLNQAFLHDRFTLYQQPIIPLNHDGAGHNGEGRNEVLLRMWDEQGTLVPPGAFIPAAERYNLMPDIDRWVIANCCRHLSPKNASNGEAQGVYSINLSGVSLGDDQLLPFICEQFKRNEINPAKICFEITETAAIANVLKAKQFMQELKKLGTRFSLDDFGSGLSSFAYLQNFSVDYLKIDGGFVKDIATNDIHRAMVGAINEIGHVMGIKTIAEFVETQSTLQVLAELGVDYAQGLAIGGPHPLI